MFIRNVRKEFIEPAPEWLTNMRGQIGRNAYWRQGHYVITGVRNGCYLLGRLGVPALKDDVKVL